MRQSCFAPVNLACTLAAAAVTAGCAQAMPATVRVGDAAALERAIAGGATTVLLSPGDYGDVRLHGVQPARMASVRPAVGDGQVRFRSLVIDRSRNLALSGIVVALEADAKARSSIVNSEAIRLSAMQFRGWRGLDGLFAGSALTIRNSRDVRVEASRFEEIGNGIAYLDSSEIVIARNHFSGMSQDAMRGGGVDGLTISGNVGTNFRARQGSHPDFIQLWTTNAKSGNRRVRIIGNLFHRGSGSAPQGIFMRDEHGRGYDDILIENNVILGAIYHGIAVEPSAARVTIRGNSVLGYRDTVEFGHRVPTSWIRYGPSMTVIDNEATAFSDQVPGPNPPPKSNRLRNLLSVKEGDAIAARWLAAR